MSGQMAWFRMGCTVYALEHDSWHGGKELFRNRWSFHVQRGPQTPESECEEIAEFARCAPETAAELERAREDIAELVKQCGAVVEASDAAIAQYDAIGTGVPEEMRRLTDRLRAALAKHARTEDTESAQTSGA